MAADRRVDLLKRANKLSRQGKIEPAIEEYKKIIIIKPDDLEVRRIVGNLQEKQNNIPEAIEQYEWIADYYVKEGFFAKAIAMYKKITRLVPGHEGAQLKLAELYTKQGLVMEAKQIYLDIAEECKRQNNQKKALGMYKKILEFDRTNIKMRLLLADNYLKEKLENDAVNEYVTAADIILNKKDFARAEELLLNTLRKVKNPRIIEKLIYLYTKSNEDEKAIKLINQQGVETLQNVDLLKVVVELYLKKNMMDEAEKIFSKITELDPRETEIMLRLGKVYIQREDYDGAFNLFLPIINKGIQNKKYDESANLLRFIIASNNSYLPALTKLAEIFKVSGKTNNLIALNESLLPVYEEKGMKEELKKTLEELIQLSDTPFSYEEQLAKLTGEEAKAEEEAVEEKESEREKEFVDYNLRTVEEAIKVSKFSKAIDTLKKAKATFPKNVEIRKKLFEVYLEAEQIELAVDEGKGLLELYKFLHIDDEYGELLEKLSTLKPEDDRLAILSGEGKTSIDITFDAAELNEQIQEIATSDLHEAVDAADEGDDVLVLSEAENVTASPVVEVEGEESSKSLSSVLSEVDFYVNDGYFGDAEKLIDQLKQKYPGNKLLLAKIEKLKKTKMEALQKGDSASSGMGLDFEIERSESDGMELETAQKQLAGGERTENIGIENAPSHDEDMIYQGADSGIEINLNVDDMDSSSDSSSGIKFSEEDFADSGVPDHIPLDVGMDMEPETAPEPGPGAPEPELEPELELEAEQESEPYKKLGTEDVFELDPSMSADNVIPPTMPEIPPTMPKMPPPPVEELPEPEPAKPESEPESISGDLFEIESSIAEESSMVQEFEDSKLELKIGDEQLQKPSEIKPKAEEPDLNVADYEIELEEPAKTDDVPIMGIDEDLLVQSPSVSPDSRGKVPDDHSSSIEEIDLDSIMVGKEEDSVPDLDTPFKEMSSSELAFDSEEELLQDEVPFLDDEAYLEIEKNVDNELKSIKRFSQSKQGLTLPLEHDSKDKHQVMCTVFSPPIVKIGSEILVQVFAHLYKKSQEAQQMAKEFDEDTKRRGAKSLQTAIQKGTELMFELKMKDAVIADPIQTLIWRGYTESVSYDVKIPENFTKNSLIGKVFISQNTVPIGMINFRIKIQKIEDKILTRPKPLPIGEAKIYKYAFVSYASEDREEVLRRVQMLSLLKIDYFQDIFGLDPGDRWEKKLYQKIDEADVFFLFWSNAARNSQWVRKEISYAIQRKQGIDENPPEIIPVIIEGPPVPEPPSELKHIHFNDKMIYFINR